MNSNQKTKSKDKKGGSRVLPPFLQKLRIITQTVPREIAGWSDDGLSFCVFSPAFKDTLAMHFKGNIQTFVRQLHFYGFRKFEQKGCEFCFAHKFFKRDQPDLIHKIRRKSRAENLDGFATTEEVHALEETVNDIKTTVDDLRAKLQTVSDKLGINYVSKVSPTIRPDSPDGSDAKAAASSNQSRKYNTVPRQQQQQVQNRSNALPNNQQNAEVKSNFGSQPLQQRANPPNVSNVGGAPCPTFSPSPSGGNIRVNTPQQQQLPQNVDPRVAMNMQQQQQLRRQQQFPRTMKPSDQGQAANNQVRDVKRENSQWGTMQPQQQQQQPLQFNQQQQTPNNSTNFGAQGNLDPDPIQRQHSLDFYPLANGDAYEAGMSMFDDSDMKQDSEEMGGLDYWDFDGVSNPNKSEEFGGFDFT